MNKVKYLLIIILVTLIVFFVVQNQEKEDNLKVIAIATLMPHPALDQVQESLIMELQNSGLIEGKDIRYIYRNANGQVQLASNIANELVSLNPDVIVAITTPMAQAIVKVAHGPVVFAAVTDPVGAGLVKSVEVGEEYVSGTSDAWPYKEQLELIRKILPKSQKIGVLFNPGEAASQYGIKQIKKLAPRFNFKLIEGSVSSTGEVYPVAMNIANRVDVLYLSSDNTVIGGIAAAVKVAIENRKPLFVGDSGTVEKGGLATVSVGYAELGRLTGVIVKKFLNGEKYIPTVIAKGQEIYINLKSAELMGISIPKEVLNRATMVYKEIKE